MKGFILSGGKGTRLRPLTYTSAEELLAHAVLISEPFIGTDPFVMYLGDNLLNRGIRSFVEQFIKEKPAAQILLTPVPDPQMFGVAELQIEARGASLHAG